jgi:Flp pilus assembly protein TadB
LDLYFKNGGWKEFGFKDNKTEEESIRGESIFSIFRDYVKQHNSDEKESEKIFLKPGFLTTSSGTFFIVCIAILILAAIIFILSKNPRSFPFLIMSIFIFIPLLVKRSQDKKLYEKMSKLD